MDPKGRPRQCQDDKTDRTVSPDYEGWKELRESRSPWERVLYQLEKLDAGRLIPVSALIAVGYCVLENGPWYAYATVFAVTTTAMLIDVLRRAVQRE